MTPINELPIELLEKILSYLDIKDKFRCEVVCQRWQQCIFASIKGLMFDGSFDMLRGFHKHVIDETNQLRYMDSTRITIMKCVLSKCGVNLRSFRGIGNLVLMETVAKYAKFLHCVDVKVNNKEMLTILDENYGNQLTCLSLHMNVDGNIASFIPNCSTVTSLAVVSSRYSVDLFDISLERKELPDSFKCLRNLVIEGIVTEKTIEQLLMFNELEMVSITLSQEMNESEQWTLLMKRWSGLKKLDIKVLGTYCLHIDVLPPNLEYLSIRAYDHRHSFDISNIKTHFPMLKKLVIYQYSMSYEDISSLLKLSFCCYEELETLCIAFDKGPYCVIDSVLAPLLVFSSLKELSLGISFSISDSFAAELMTKLVHLTSFGTCVPFGRQSHGDYLVPSGEAFWKAVSDKAASCTTRTFSFIGQANGTVRLYEPLPPNVSLVLKNSATIKLRSRFRRSNQWQRWTTQWCQMSSLSIEIVDTSYDFSCLPKSLEKLIIACFCDDEDCDTGPLSFKTLLPKLKELTLFQQKMSNVQLLLTLECVAECCPNLKALCVTRGNQGHSPVDSYITPLFHLCQLESLCLTQNTVVSDEFSAQLADGLQSLREFGCGDQQHHLGFTCGRLFTTALCAKVRRGQKVTLCGGPSGREVACMIKPFKPPPGLLQVRGFIEQ